MLAMRQSITINDVPADTVTALRKQALREGLTLEQFLRDRLFTMAAEAGPHGQSARRRPRTSPDGPRLLPPELASLLREGRA